MRILHRGIFSCVAVGTALLACSLAWPQWVAAQDERPQIMPGERRPTKKKATGPRALAILQLGANGKSSLVPVAILIDGKFWDASSYKADPVPMALEAGTIYEAQRTGNSLGLFTVSSALHSNAANVSVPWLGTGTWRPTETESKIVEIKTESAPKGLEDADAAPRLTRDPSRVQGVPSNSPQGSGGSAPSSGPSSDKPKSSDGDEPPRLSKGSPPSSSEPPANAPSAGQNPSPSSTSAPASTSGSGDSKPAKPDATQAADAKADEKSKTPPSDSGATEANRPRLRRGMPAKSFADEDIPGYSRPGAKLAANAGKVVTTVAATQADAQLIPAISDASQVQLRPFTFDWLKGEEEDRRKQMVALAKEQLRAYIDTKKSNAAAKPAHPAATHRASVPEPILETVQMSAYDLWKSNKPIMVLSATAHLPAPPAGSAHSEYTSEIQYSMVIVAYPDIYNNLHKLYSSVTDKFHLDVTPRLELIDAVDVDGDGIGELLFRETTDQGTGWVIYRPTADKLWKMYDSLMPEG